MSITIVAQQTNDEYFYYYKGKRILLPVDSSKLVLMTNSMPQSTFFQYKGLQLSGIYSISKQTTNAYNKLAQNSSDKKIYTTTLQLSNDIKNLKNVSAIAREFKNTHKVLQVQPVFRKGGKFFWATNNINVKLYELRDTVKLQKYAKRYSLNILGNNEFMPQWYMLSCSEETQFNSLKISNILCQSGDFVTAEPELCGDIVTNCGYVGNENEILDSLYQEQWGLKNTGNNCDGTPGIDINIEEAWTLATGEGVKVAVIDTGVFSEHPDLASNMDTLNYDADFDMPLYQTDDAHGTRCAGIIAAIHNDVGIRGVAPKAKIMSARFFEFLVNDLNSVDSITKIQRTTKVANCINWSWQNGADILSCSWYTQYPSQMIDDAVIDALTKGRNGKGCIVVFASGNNNSDTLFYPCTIHSNLLNVGAIGYTGYRLGSEYHDNYASDYGTDLDVVAPGLDIISTSYKKDKNNKIIPAYHNISHTSSACPHVSGLAALILSVNPNLKGIMVNDIIESTARKINPDYYTYSPELGRRNGLRNTEMGYGLIDATAAVKRALEIKYISNSLITESDTISGREFIFENTKFFKNINYVIQKHNRVIFKSNVSISKGASINIESLRDSI